MIPRYSVSLDKSKTHVQFRTHEPFVDKVVQMRLRYDIALALADEAEGALSFDEFVEKSFEKAGELLQQYAETGRLFKLKSGWMYLSQLDDFVTERKTNDNLSAV